MSYYDYDGYKSPDEEWERIQREETAEIAWRIEGSPSSVVSARSR